MSDSFEIDGKTIKSRLFLGTAGYPSPDILKNAVLESGTGLITTSLRRENAGGSGEKFWSLIKGLNVPILPNTAGCYGAKQAITTAHMAREIFDTNWIKLETIGDDYTLAPDPKALLVAAETLVKDGFFVFPYMTDDIDLAEKLVGVGCKVLMPWGAPIGSGIGVKRPCNIKVIRRAFPDITLVVDAGIGAPSQAASAMEIGCDAVLLNTAVAKAGDPVLMARAFSKCIAAGRSAKNAGIITPQPTARPSTPVVGTPFWRTEDD